ncbi:MAG: hypothetical protein HC840_10545 [Leptolyngbyaceae cyanobacterium RM2_2_4]|nr:hypothetical protein [Leptolyngbyaceae cyanobacterium RM2_2_4]
MTAESTKPFQDAALQVRQTLDQTIHRATNSLQSTQLSIQTTIQETVDHATASTTAFFQTAVQNLQSSTAEFSTKASTGFEGSVETATSFTLEKIGQALSGTSWLVVKGYLWVSSKVSTGAQQAILETTGAEVAPDPAPIVNIAPEVSNWVILQKCVGCWYFMRSWAGMPSGSGKTYPTVRVNSWSASPLTLAAGSGGARPTPKPESTSLTQNNRLTQSNSGTGEYLMQICLKICSTKQELLIVPITSSLV